VKAGSRRPRAGSRTSKASGLVSEIIAGAFHRTGAIEVWGRGTNRVIEASRAYGIAEPTFTEGSGAVTVTVKAEIVADLGRAPSQVGPKCGPSSSAGNCGRTAKSADSWRARTIVQQLAARIPWFQFCVATAARTASRSPRSPRVRAPSP
jgi:hypothetical protein